MPRGITATPPSRSPAQRNFFKRRILVWRARMSVPSMLASGDERGVISLFAAVNAGIAILGISALAWMIELPLLFPALGPSAFLLFSRPFSIASAPRQVVVGHSVAIVGGMAVWYLVSLASGQAVTLDNNGWPVLVSASASLAVTSIILVRLAAPHAPACGTALIIALGLANDGYALLGMATGVVFLTLQAIAMNRIAGVCSPTWSPRLDDVAD